MLKRLRWTRRGGAVRSRGLHRLLRHQGGSLVIPFALMLPVLLGAIGLSTDYMTMTLIRTELQAAVDGAALTGARKMVLSGVTAKDIRSTVDVHLEQAVDPRNGQFTAATEPDLKGYSVKVELSQEWTPFFAHFISAAVTPVEVKATAKLVGTTNVCLLTLHPSMSAAVHLTMLARINANNCAVYANSTSGSAIRLDLLGQLKAGFICSAGGYAGLLSHFAPAPTTDCPVLPDPLAKMPQPGAGACDHDGLVLKEGTAKLKPGVYCGGLTVKGTAEAVFEPGTHVIRGGAFSVSGKATVRGKNAGFFLDGEKAVIEFRGQSTIELSGQEDGPMAGLLFFEDRSVSKDRVHLINSINARLLTGTIYLPRGKLVVDPNAPVAPDSAYTAIVARQVELTQGPTLILNSNYDLSPVPVPEGIRASSRVLLTD